jgi:hypothetical protein
VPDEFKAANEQRRQRNRENFQFSIHGASHPLAKFNIPSIQKNQLQSNESAACTHILYKLDRMIFSKRRTFYTLKKQRQVAVCLNLSFYVG